MTPFLLGLLFGWICGYVWPHRHWLALLFSKTTNPGYSGRFHYLKTIVCRWQHHPLGAVFYNPGGDEPDWRCRRCGEYLA